MCKGILLSTIVCMMVYPVQVNAQNCVRHPGRCLKKAATIVLTPATAPIDMALGEKIGSTAKSITDDGSAIVKGTGDEIAELGKATENYFEAVFKSVPQGASNFERRLREDRFADAFLGLAGDNLKAQQDALATAAESSDVIDAVGSTAATAYGGPGGAAAYAAWRTYKQTGGDVDAALRAGAIAGFTSAGMTSVSDIPSTSISTKKAIAGGAIGGLAVAASGGDDNDVLGGFLAGGGMIIVQDGYRSYVGSPLDARASSGDPPFCMATVLAECSPPEAAYVRNDDGSLSRVVDVRKTDLRVTHVGTAADLANPSLFDERSPLMIGISKVPGMNAMSIIHDSWVIDFNMTTLANQATILPAIVVTYVGTGSPLYGKLISENTRNGTHVVTNWPRSPTSVGRPDVGQLVSYGNRNRIDVDVFACAMTDEAMKLALLVYNSFATMDIGRVRLRHGNIYGGRLNGGISIIADSNHPELRDAQRFRDTLARQFDDRDIRVVSNVERATRWYLSVGVC